MSLEPSKCKVPPDAFRLVGRTPTGIEPATLCARGRCSSAELRRNATVIARSRAPCFSRFLSLRVGIRLLLDQVRCGVDDFKGRVNGCGFGCEQIDFRVPFPRVVIAPGLHFLPLPATGA